MIIAGDFNDWKSHGNRTLGLQRDLHEAFERHHGHLARTYPARLPLLRLDRIYLRNAESHGPRILGTNLGRTCQITCRWPLKCDFSNHSS